MNQPKNGLILGDKVPNIIMSLHLRYEKAPQMREYDKIGQIWLPYLMYFNEPGYCSDVVNTDSRGFRIVIDNNSKIVSDFNTKQDTPVCLLVGGSTVFGVGATNDAYTIPSLMNYQSDFLWYNFGGRAYGSTQEFILFLLHTPFLKKIKRVIILSGVNNLILYYLSKEYPKEIGSFFFSNQYRTSMNNINVSMKRKILKLLLQPFFGNKIDYYRASKKEILSVFIGNDLQQKIFTDQGIYKQIVDHDKEKNDLLYALKRDIENWKLISKAFQFEIIYALQPLANWIKKKYSDEEKILFSELDKYQPEHWKILKNKMDYDQHSWFSNSLKKICGDCDMQFFDMNKELASHPIDNKWLFVDRIHLTDKGYQLLADILKEKL